MSGRGGAPLHGAPLSLSNGSAPSGLGKWDLLVSAAVSCWVVLGHRFLGQAGKLLSVLGGEKEAWKLLTDNPIQHP